MHCLDWQKGGLTLDKVFAAIDSEPEYPGEMPEDLKVLLENALKNLDLNLLTQALRISVKSTKEGIKQRILEIK
jgi:hypothetical protein